MEAEDAFIRAWLALPRAYKRSLHTLFAGLASHNYPYHGELPRLSADANAGDADADAALVTVKAMRQAWRSAAIRNPDFTGIYTALTVADAAHAAQDRV